MPTLVRSVSSLYIIPEASYGLLSATLRLFPGITAASARIFLAPPIQGVILESFGAGYDQLALLQLPVYRQTGLKGTLRSEMTS